jgi:hypothetical protein
MKQVRKRPASKSKVSKTPYVAALEAENAKLHRQIAKLEVSLRSTENRLKAVEAEFKENRPTLNYNIDTGRHEPTEAELVEKARSLGYRLEKISRRAT